MDIFQIVFFAVGLLIGGTVVAVFYRQKQKSLDAVEQTREKARTEMENAFANLSLEALNKSSDAFLKLAGEHLSKQTATGEKTLDEKKKLIDANLKTMTDNLANLRKETIALKTGLSSSQQETAKLRDTTQDLRNVLSSSQARGQWGEKMVVDILNFVGLVEGLNFVQQKQVESGETPDFTFLLPKNKKVNLDSKFPLTHYEKYIIAENETEQETEKKQFLNDVKGHLKAVAKRGYIDPAAGTVDYVLVFIPNESIYAFIHQSDSNIVDNALKDRIILCSPITLYAVISLIHQAVSNFAFEQQTEEITKILADVQKNFDKYTEGMEKMGKRITDAQKEYDALTTTRTKMLDRPLRKIKDMMSSQEDDKDLLPDESAES